MMRGRGDLGRTLAMFRRFAIGQRRMFVAAIMLLAIEALASVYQPTLIGALINFLKTQQPWSVLGFTPAPDATIQVLAIAIIAVTAVMSLADSLAETSLARVGRMIGFNLRVTLFGHLQKLSLAFHLQRRTGDVLTRITGDVEALEDFVVESVSDLAGSMLVLSSTLAWLFYKSVKVAMLALIIVPILAVVSNYFARRIKAAAKLLRAREGELASTAQEMLSSISVVQIYGRGDYEQDRFAHKSRSAMAAVLRTARLEAAFSFTVSVLGAAVIAGVVWIGALWINPPISAGLLVTFILQIQNMFKPTRRIIQEWNTVGKVQASVERIGELLDREPSVDDSPDARTAPKLSGDIEFRDVSFAYQPGPEELDDDTPTRLAIQGLTFRVAPGEVVALVGHSGAGKSTVAQLVPRLYDPHAGAVLLNGHDIRQFTVASLRAQIAMVLQETVLFSGSVADNIAYGRPDATRAEIIEAARQANAHDFIVALPNGYDTPLGERAATLSGGQRQRLAIARAFIRDASILILDEPTTGLDAESARAVVAALRTLVQGRSALIVSHDFKLIQSVDRILVLSAGRILEEGTPADLLTRGGLYAQLYAREFGELPALEGAVVGAGDRRVVADDFAEGQTVGTRAASRAEDRSRTFERILTSAVPQPASAETFRALTGRAPSRGLRPLEDSDLDPMLSPALNRAMPGLAEALDADAMAPRLQGILADGWQLEWCTPRRAVVIPGDGVRLVYQLGLQQSASGRTAERLVAGRLFMATESADHWLTHEVLPLAARVAGREDVSVFRTLGDLVRPLRMVLHGFPVDPDRPGLLAATDPNGMANILGQALAGSVDGLAPVACRPEVVGYDHNRCVLRYEVLWRVGATGRTLKQVLYGRVYADERGALVGPAVDAVRAHTQESGANRSMVIPRFRGYLPEHRMVLLDAVPGSPQLKPLIREWATDTGRRSAVDEVLATCARMTAGLHNVPTAAGPLRTLRTEHDAVQTDIAAIAGLAPALANSLASGLDSLAEVMDQEPLLPAFGQGDFTPGRFLFDGPLVGMAHFDAVCAAEPALDLGQLTAHMTATAAKAKVDGGGSVGAEAQEPSRSFMMGYARCAGIVDETALMTRTAAYRRVSLARMALDSFLRLKPARALLAQRLLDQELQAADVPILTGSGDLASHR